MSNSASADTPSVTSLASMKTLLRTEELLLSFLAFFLFLPLGYSWWWFLVLFLAPDLGMLGYLFRSRVGAVTYNTLHHKGLAIVLYVAGSWLSLHWLQLAGLVIFAHSSLDRVLGYGLKHMDSFLHTHLGMIGRALRGREAQH